MVVRAEERAGFVSQHQVFAATLSDGAAVGGGRPRPSSSTHTKEFFVASRKGFAISDISTANVENPERKSSLAPMRTKNGVACGEVESLRGDRRAHVREDGGYADLSEIRGFATHVRTGEKKEVFVR